MVLEIPKTDFLLLVVDLEGTCCNDGSIPDNKRETIEIGAVVVNDYYEELTSFQVFVHPVRYRILTKFCSNLTSITQDDVDQAPKFPEALELFLEWRNRFPDALFCSWGSYDRKQLKRDCEFHNISYPFTDHCDLSTLFTKKMKKRVTHRKAMKILGIKPVGKHHRGLYDAINIVKILPFLFE